MYLWQFEHPSMGMKGLHIRAGKRCDRKSFCDALAQIKAGESQQFDLNKLIEFEDMNHYRWKRHGFRKLTVCVVEHLERPTMATDGNGWQCGDLDA